MAKPINRSQVRGLLAAAKCAEDTILAATTTARKGRLSGTNPFTGEAIVASSNV